MATATELRNEARDLLGRAMKALEGEDKTSYQPLWDEYQLKDKEADEAEQQEATELAFALRELKAKIIPLNVLVPVKGTPLEHTPPPAAADTLKAFALMRLVNPRAVIKFAAGRETVMKDFQGLLMLAGANGFLTGGYLTTRGRDAEDDENFLRELTGFGNL